MFIKTPQQSQRILLRPFEESNILLWNTWDSSPQIQEYIPEPFRLLTAEEQIEYFVACRESEDEIHAAVIDTIDNKTIGTISLTEISYYHGIGELGIVIGDTAYYGKGYGLEAMQLFINYLQNETDIVRVSAECEEENIPMQRIFEKLGFIKECVKLQSRVKKGVRINTVQYSMLLK